MDDDVDPHDPKLEWKLRAAAVPSALVLAVVFHASSTGHWFQRTFLSMMVHELGHATTGWLTGFRAIPTLWKTLIPETRSVVTTIVVLALAAYFVWRGLQAQRGWLVAGIGLALVTIYGTLMTSPDDAHVAIIFGGDGGAMVLGTGLMMTFFAHHESPLVRGKLRWGFLVIGAAAFVDTFATWWTARHDSDVIPYGELENVGPSDPSLLTDAFSWSERQLVHRYVTLGVACLVVLAAVWAWSVWRARVAASFTDR